MGQNKLRLSYDGQIYVSTDSGNTWTAKESNRDWWSVAMSADGTKQTAVVIMADRYMSQQIQAIPGQLRNRIETGIQ